MIGALNPSAIIAAQLAGQNQMPGQPPMSAAPEPFTWGQGGRRMTPDDIARERELASRMTQTDYSPIYSPWQGLARVSENLFGALRERKADKAAAQNADYGQQIIQSLLNPGGVPSASGAPGAPPPGANIAQLSAIVADPYLPDSAKAVAQMQIDQAQKLAMKQFEYANRELPEVAQLANIANDPTQPEWTRKAAQDRITALNDPVQVVPGLVDGQPFVGRLSALPALLGAQGGGGATNTGDIIDDPRKQGGPTPSASGNF